MESELAIVMNNLYPGYKLKIPNIPVHQEVDYDDATHKYYLKERVYRSATTIVSQFYRPFDKKERSEWMAYRYGRTPEYWLDKWRRENTDSHDRGNRQHAHQEKFLYNVGYTRVSKAHYDGPGSADHNRHHRVYDPAAEVGLFNRIDTLADGCYPELKLWRHDWGIAGRADKPTFETINGVRYAHVEDYKTNKKIARNGFVGRDGEEMMLYPVEHLPHCEYSHYCLQLSIYQYMLEYFGYEPGLRRLIHFPHEIEGLGIPDPVIYELPYLRDEVISMLITLKERSWLN
jgi:hypothetical protein